MNESSASASIPLEQALEERLAWLIRLRWLAGLGLVVGSFVGVPMFTVPVPYPPLAAIGVGVVGYNVLLYLFARRLGDVLGSHRRVVHVQIALDWAALAATVALTGGILSPATAAFVFHLIIGAFLLSARACCYLAVVASALAGLAAWAVPAGEGVVAGGGPALAPWFGAPVTQIWLGLTFLFAVTTYLATSITGRLREKEAALWRSERSLARAYRGMAALYELGQRVNATLDVSEVLSLIACHATRLLGGKASAIRLLDASGRRLEVGGTFGLSDAYVNKGPVEVENSGVDADVLRGTPVQLRDVVGDARFQYPEEARREGLRSMLSCPMRARDRTLGVIRVYTATPHTFSSEEIHLLMNLANLGAVAIQNARSYGDLLALDQERVWFARTTHHQLRAPLAAVQAAIDALPFAGPLTTPQTDLVTRARRRIQDAFDTIRDLLDLAAAQRLQAPGLDGCTDAVPALRHVTEVARERSQAKRLAFEGVLPDHPCPVALSAGDLDRLFTNLLDNAVKYTSHGAVGLASRVDADVLETVVSDTGIGIAAGDAPRVFESFFRAAAAKATGEVGTGLGLSIVQTLARRAGGTVSFSSSPGSGSRFVVRLPLVPQPTPPAVSGTLAAADRGGQVGSSTSTPA